MAAQQPRQFHLTYSPPTDIWPDGFWGLYEINGDQIAERIVFKEIVPGKNGPPYYKGPVIARHSWCGYVGGYGSLDQAVAAIRARS